MRYEDRLAVCSWSLQPAGPADLAAKVAACGVPGVQLHLDPIRDGSWNQAQTGRALGGAGIAIVSGMMAMAGEDYATLESIARTGGVRPDTTWHANLEAAHANAAIALALGIDLVTFHAGFVPHDRADPERRTIVQRTRAVAEAFWSRGVAVALETGQESAENLLTFLDEVNAGAPEGRRVGVNFDPANMILYGTGEPIAALRLLLPHVVQVHLKDARPSPRAGEWGTETPVGEGRVPWREFFALVTRTPAVRRFVLEREGGESRVHDLRTGAALARSILGSLP